MGGEKCRYYGNEHTTVPSWKSAVLLVNIIAGMRPWTKPGDRRGIEGAEPTKALSKLDNARLKLSKFKVKYGKQEKQRNLYSPSSSTDLSLEESLTDTPSNIPKILSDKSSENSDFGKNLEDKGRHSEKNSSIIISKKKPVSDLEENNDSSVIVFKKGPISTISANEQGLYNEGLKFSDELQIKSPEDSSMSEILENVRSFSSLEIQDEEPLSLKPVLILTSAASSVKGEDQGLAEVVVEELETGELTLLSKDSSVQSEEQGLAEVVVEQLETGELTLLSKDSSVQSEEQGLAEVVVEELETVELTLISKDSNVNSEEQGVREVMDKELQRSESSLQSKLQESRNNTSTIITSESITLKGPPKKGPRRRNAKVQTETKRSRTVQVNLSTTECSYERLSCPTLRASSLPLGLRTSNETLDLSAEDGEKLLVRSQIHLTLGLLRREQALYVNCCRAAARLEKNYRRHTLSETRKFILVERRLREELRRNAR